MTLALHRLQPGETDYDLLALGVSAGAAAVGGCWLAAGWPLPHCAFHALTGCPCPACGATRCVLALLHGHVREALAWNPLAFLALLGVGGFNLYAAAAAGARWPRIRFALAAGEARVLRIAAVAALLLNWGYLLHRGV